jgi:hypothetical protein
MRRFILTSSVRLSLAAFASLAALPACGSLDTHADSSPALATIQGQLVNTSSTTAVSGPVRVAVVWQAGSGGFNVAEDLPVQPVFPSSFTIQLDDPPPASAMVDGSEFFGGGSGATPPSDAGVAPTGPNGAVATKSAPTGSSSGSTQVALGSVVAYLDKNGNGKLDLVPTDASGYVDQILATNVNQLLIYIQGAIPSQAVDELGHLPSEGYDLYSTCDVQLPYSPSPGSICATPPDAGPPQAACYLQWQSVASPITLTVATDPEVNSLMCQTLPGGSESVGANQPLPGRPATYPSPCDPNLACAPDGSSYTYGSCQTVATGICEGTQTNCTSVEYSRPSPVPSDWPCVASSP